MSVVEKEPLRGKYGDITDAGLGMKNALFEFNPGKCILPEIYECYAEQILNAPVRHDDIWLISYPRTGSTWCQEIIWLVGNNLDFEKAESTLQQLRAPLIETSAVLFEYTEQFKGSFTNSVEYINSLPSPRFIKSHLPYSLLPTEIDKVKPKVIYTMRNPKDICVSYYYHCKLFHNFKVEFETFCELFLNGAVAYGNVFDHCLEFWKRRNSENILVLTYEEMKKDLRNTVERIARFMEKALSDEEIDDVVKFVSFGQMKKNKACNCETLVETVKGADFFQKEGYHFIRKGEIGDWKNHMTDDISRKFDEWIDRKTKGTDLNFQ